MAISLALITATTVSRQSLFKNSKAYAPEPCKICESGRCHKIANYPACHSSYNDCDCANGSVCSACGGSGGGGGGGGAGYYCVNRTTHQCSYVTSGAQYATYNGCLDACRNTGSGGGTCTAAQNNTYKCGGNGYLKKCVNGSWVDQFVCQNCDILDEPTNLSYYCRGSGGSTPAPTGTQCTSGEQKCSNDRTRLRNCVNGNWIDTVCRGCLKLNSGAFTCNG